MLSTSGTTESPKFVRLSKKNIEDNTIKIIKYLKIKKIRQQLLQCQQVILWTFNLNSHLKAKSKIVLNNNSIIEKSFWEKNEKI